MRADEDVNAIALSTTLIPALSLVFSRTDNSGLRRPFPSTGFALWLIYISLSLASALSSDRPHTRSPSQPPVRPLVAFHIRPSALLVFRRTSFGLLTRDSFGCLPAAPTSHGVHSPGTVRCRLDTTAPSVPQLSANGGYVRRLAPGRLHRHPAPNSNGLPAVRSARARDRASSERRHQYTSPTSSCSRS